MQDREAIGFYDKFLFDEKQFCNNGIILRNKTKKEFISQKEYRTIGNIYENPELLEVKE